MVNVPTSCISCYTLRSGTALFLMAELAVGALSREPCCNPCFIWRSWKLGDSSIPKSSAVTDSSIWKTCCCAGCRKVHLTKAGPLASSMLPVLLLARKGNICGLMWYNSRQYLFYYFVFSTYINTVWAKLHLITISVKPDYSVQQLWLKSLCAYWAYLISRRQPSL